MSQAVGRPGGKRARGRLDAASLTALEELFQATRGTDEAATRRLLAEHARLLAGADASAIYMFDPAEQRLLVAGASGADPPAPEQAAEAFERGVTVAGPGAVAVVLEADGRRVGVIAAGRRGAHAFDAEAVHLLEAFARLTAPSLEARGLRRWREQHARLFQSLHEVAVAAAGLEQAADLARLAVDRARDLLDADGGSVAWWDGDASQLTVIQSAGVAEAAGTAIRPGEGAHGMAYRWREAVSVPDYAAWEHALEDGAGAGVGAAAAVPLIVRDVVVGTLAVFTGERRPFAPDEVEGLRLLGGQVAPAIEAARLLQDAGRQVDVFKSLHEVAVAAGGVLDPARVSQMAVAAATRLLGTDRSLLRLFEPELGTLRAYADSDGDPADSPDLAPGEGMAGACFATGRPVIVDDYLSTDYVTEWGQLESVRAAIVVPLVSRDRTLGTLTSLDGSRRHFGERDLELLSLLAAQVAPVVEAARLSHAAEERARVFRALHDLAVAAGGVFDEARLGQLMVESAVELLGVDQAVISIAEPPGDVLEVVALCSREAEPPPAVAPGMGTAGAAFARGEPVIVDDYKDWKRGTAWAEEHGYLRALAVPIKVGDRPIGALTALSRTAGRFSEDDVRLLSLVSSQLGPAMAGARLHASLAASERSLRAIYDTAPMLIARNTLDGHVIWMNRAGTEMFGYTDADSRDLDRDRLLAPEDASADRELLAELVSGRRERFRVQRRYVRRDGSRFWGDVTISLVRDAEGRPEFYYSMVEDITERRRAENAVRESESRKWAILAAALDAVVAIDDERRVVEFNPAAEQAFGCVRARALGEPVERFLELSPGVPLDGRPGRHAATGRHSGGRRFPVEISVGAFAEAGRRTLSIAVRDLSEQRQAEAERRESEERFQAVFDRAAIGIARLELDGTVIEANPALHRMLEVADQALDGRRLTDLLHPEDRPALRLESLAAGDANEHQAEVRYLARGSAEIWGNTIASAVRSPDGRPSVLILLVEDVTLRKAQLVALEHRALHDPLTDLPNRTLLQDRLQHAVVAARREREAGALLVLDLDGFKEVNDQYGHHAGDALLRLIGERLRSELRASDTVARLGGDEFAVVLPGIAGGAAALATAGKLVTAMGEPFDVEGRQVRVAASIGVAVFPDDGTDVDTLMRNADAAMYAAKRESRGSALFRR